MLGLYGYFFMLFCVSKFFCSRLHSNTHTHSQLNINYTVSVLQAGCSSTMERSGHFECTDNEVLVGGHLYPHLPTGHKRLTYPLLINTALPLWNSGYCSWHDPSGDCSAYQAVCSSALICCSNTRL